MIESGFFSGGDWLLERITALHCDSDIIVRSIEVFTDNKTSMKSIEKFILFEMSEPIIQKLILFVDLNSIVDDLSTRPSRLAS